jgi:hypothetical protein
MLGDEHFGRTEEDRAELAATALMEACYQENVDVLKRLKPDPNRDNLTELLNCAAGLSRKEIIKYLLELGAQPNDKANGASTAMDRCLLHLPSRKYRCVDPSASGFQLGSASDHGITGRIGETRSYLATG